MILAGELKVQERHRDKARDNHQQQKGQKENNKASGDLVTPHAGENVVQLDVNRREWHETGNQELKGTTLVKGNIRGNRATLVVRVGALKSEVA